MDFLDINKLKDLLKKKSYLNEDTNFIKKEYFFVSRQKGKDLFYLSLSNREKDNKKMILSGKQIEYKNMVADKFPEKISEIIDSINQAAESKEDALLRQKEVNKVSKKKFDELDELAMDDKDCFDLKLKVNDLKKEVENIPDFEWVKAPKNGINEEAYSAINITKDPKEIEIIVNEIKSWNEIHNNIFPIDGMFISKQTIGKEETDKITMSEFNKILESFSNE